MKKILLIFLPLCILQILSAQTGEEVFTFLRYPTSTRINALGGNQISLIERDPSMIFHNPGLLGGEMDGMINLNYMNYISDINIGSALFTKAVRERSAWGVGASFISYGSFKQMSADNMYEGDFSANDVCLTGFYSYDLTDRWRGGISLKFLYSGLESYTSIGLGVDAGLSYYNSENEFSAGIVLKNIGAQLTTYQEERQKMPWDIQLGVSKKMEYSPFRFSLTAMYLNRWKFDYIDNVDKDRQDDSFFRSFAKHLVLGIDYIPSDNFWLGIGFNPKTNMDMKLQTGNKLSGFSAGAGVTIKMFDVGVSVAKYHPSAMSLMLSVSTTLADFKP